MKLVFPKVELQQGTTLCLHIPHGFHEEKGALEEEILQTASQQSKTAVVCHPATRRSGFLEFFRKQKSIEWLAQNAGISKTEAAKIISEFGIPVAEHLSSNPGTPRCLLGIAAALARKPQVIAYSAAALDPEGRNRVHRYIASKGNEACLIHLSLPSVYGTGQPAPRNCPRGACCIEF